MKKLITVFAITGICLGFSAGAHAAMFRMATSHPVDHMATKTVKETIAAIEKETEGRVKIRLFPANQMGDYVQVFDEVQRGTLDIAHISMPETHDPRLGACMLPYVASDYATVKKAFGKDSGLYAKTAELHQVLGVKFLGFFTEGFIGIGTVPEVKSPADAKVDKGILIRTSGLGTMVAAATGLGFRTTTIPYADVFPALQTGVADGWIGGPANLNYLIFRDVIKHFYNYNVCQEVTQAVMNLKKFNSISQADQKVIVNAFNEFSTKSFSLAEQDDAEYRNLLSKAGVNVVEFSPEEIQTLSHAVRAFAWPKLADVYTQELIDIIKKDTE